MIRRVIAAIALAAIFIGCSSHHSPPQTIQSVASRLHCAKYERDVVIAPGSRESGSCYLPNNEMAQLYAMPSHVAGSYLIDLAKQFGVTAKNIKWYGNILVVTSPA